MTLNQPPLHENSAYATGSEGHIRIYKATRGTHYDADATMAVPEPYKKQLLHIISCEMYRQLQANHF